ncbi:MAG TPA: T9SS type A sorting domain-containing protein, partial [Bacteroidales bacterium]|nr:T9SS type A sorting domain-containing protein [Bacteroidales bacterium]
NCKIYKSSANTLSLINTYPCTLNAGTAYDFKITYSPSSGQIKIWINSALVASWTDPSPITSGNYISLRTGNCDGFFDNVKVRKSRGSSATITVGPYNNKDVRYESPDSTMEACRINTVINDAHGNWSSPAVKNVKIDWTGPVTSVNTPGTWQTGDFTASFIDTDSLSGVQEQFYNVSYFDGTEWSANSANGFCRDDFDNTINPIWQSQAGGGTWEIISDKLHQTDEANTNSNLYSPLNQTSGYTYLYNWTGTATGSNATLKRFGLHFFVDDPTQTNRGNSYLAFFRFDQNKIEIQKGTNNVLAFVDTVTYDLTPGITYDFKVTYTPASGLITVYLNNILMLNWTDPSPITSGSYISLRSANCNPVYDNLRVYRSRGSSQLITVGAGVNKDVMFENADTTQPSCIIYTLAIDKIKNISFPGVLNANIDWTAPLCTTVNDGTGSDIIETSSFSTLSANWMASTDTNSDIARYWYAIGTTQGGTDVAGWTDNGQNTCVTKSGLTLSAGQTYYFSVKTENGAGIISVCNSNGVIVMDPTDIEENQHNPLVGVFPNPFSDNTTVSFELTGSQHIKISLVDLLGRSILLADQVFAAGKHSIDIHTGGINITEGLYSLKFENDDHMWVEKVVHY